MKELKSNAFVERALAAVRQMWSTAYELASRHFWLLVAIVGVVSFILGILGFRELVVAAQEQQTSWRDATYQASQLIVLEANLAGENIPWQLQFARFALPIIGGVFGLGVLLTVFAEQKTFLWIWLFRHPLVIAGLGEPGFLLARSQREFGERVVVIERDPANERIREARKLGILVLIGDATDAEVLRRAGLNRAEFLISVCTDDATNGTVAMRAHEVTRDRKAGGLTCIVHVVEPQLSTLLMGYAFGGQQKNTFRLDCFNIDQSGARAMLRKFPPFADPGTEDMQPQIVIVGLGTFGRWVLVQAARRWTSMRGDSPARLRVTVVDRVASERVEYLLERFPDLDLACEITCVNALVESRELDRAAFLDATPTSLAAVYVCLSDDSLGLTAALKLHQRLLGRQVPIVVRMNKSAGFTGLLERQHDGSEVGRSIRGFGLLEQTCNTEVLKQSTYEAVAQALHDDYVRREEEAGQTPDTNPSMVPWEELSLELKESNREQAADTRDKLRSLHYDIIPRSDWEEVEAFEFTEQEVDDLAKKEQARWMAEKERQHYTYAPGVKNDSKKTHPDMLVWAKLTPAQKDKVRDPMRHLPRIFAEAEVQIVSTKGSPSDSVAT